MKSLVKAISILLAVGIPSALFAQLSGANVPAPAAAGYLLIGFAAVLTLLTAVNDYARRPRRLLLPQSSGPACAEILRLRAMRAEHRLAA